MNILYDYQILGQLYGGISRYFFELIAEIEHYENVKVDLPVVFANNYYFKKILNYKPYMKFGNRPINNLAMIKAIISARLKRAPYDIIHPTYYAPDYIAIKGKAKIVVTVHDMIAEIFYSSSRKEIENKRKCLEKADGIIAVSEYTKNDMLRIYPHLRNKKIRVIHHGSDSRHTEKKVNVPSQYILYVGNRFQYKNFGVLLKALAELQSFYADLYLICAGGSGFTEDEINHMKNLHIQSYVMQISATDEELMYLYSHARIFIFPSLYEGFGIPILEAFQNKCPVILSNCTCFPEVAGEAALYFEPNNIEDLLNKINRLLSDKEYREKMIEKGTQRLAGFQWSDTAKQTYEFYQEILQDGKNECCAR